MKGKDMKSVLVGGVISLALSWAAPAAAQMTGSSVLERAASLRKIEAGSARAPDFVNASFLQGFALGVANTLDTFDSQTCLPQGSDIGQWVRVIIQHLEANPAELHKDVTELAIAAFRKAFPCQKP